MRKILSTIALTVGLTFAALPLSAANAADCTKNCAPVPLCKSDQGATPAPCTAEEMAGILLGYQASIANAQGLLTTCRTEGDALRQQVARKDARIERLRHKLAVARRHLAAATSRT